MTKHTPGPWLFRTAPTSAGICHIVSAAGWRGAFIYGDGIREAVDDAIPRAQELAANARLIAAAPELLEACKAALSDDQHYIEKCRAAIAKATEAKP